MQAKHAVAKPVRILIVDDHPIVREGIARLLAAEGDLQVCGEAGNAGEAVQMGREMKPDLMLIDISLGGTNGIELIKQLKSQDEKLVMLVISMHDDALYAQRALRAGAMGYINKQQLSTTIVNAIRQVRQGQIYLAPTVANQMLRSAMNGGGKSLAESPVETLSDRELEVFELIGQGITTSAIAEKLHLSTKTIETHRENLKAKLRLKNANELIRYAVQWSMEKT